MNYKFYTHVHSRYSADQIANVISECIKIAYILNTYKSNVQYFFIYKEIKWIMLYLLISLFCFSHSIVCNAFFGIWHLTRPQSSSCSTRQQRARWKSRRWYQPSQFALPLSVPISPCAVSPVRRRLGTSQIRR